MKNITKRVFLLLLALGVCYVPASSAQEIAPGVWSSRNGYFRLSYTIDEDVMVEKVAYDWTLYILTRDRAPVEDATIEVHGYHPETRKILDREPIIGPYLGGGAYIIYNIYFDEPGEWDLNIIITSGTRTDAVLVPVNI